MLVWVLGEDDFCKENGPFEFASAESGGFDVEMIILCRIGCGDGIGGAEVEALGRDVKDEGFGCGGRMLERG